MSALNIIDFNVKLIILILVAFTASACSSNEWKIEELQGINCTDCSMPQLTKGGDNIYLTYTQKDSDTESSLYLRQLKDNVWSEPERIAAGSDWFVNWADFPSLFVSENHLYSFYLQKSSPETFDYNIMYTARPQNDTKWSLPRKLHDDTVSAEHGFVSFFPHGKGKAAAVWLDGRKTDNSGGMHGGEMTLMFRDFDENGQPEKEILLDDRVCDCCQTAAINSSKGPLILYRNRSKDEIRDIYLAHYDQNGEWITEPFSEDQWEIAGCPVNGPAIDAIGDHVVATWYTASGGQPRVYSKISLDGGSHFTEPLLITEGSTIGRVDCAALANGNSAISYIESGASSTTLNIAILDQKGQIILTKNIENISNSRKSGFPKMIALKDQLLMAWTDVTAKTIKSSLISLPF